MKVMVVYDSTYGNTEQVAGAIAAALAPVGDVKTLRADNTGPDNMAGVGLLVVGSPTQGGRATLAVQEFIGRIPDSAIQGLRVAAFDTRFSTRLVGIFGYAAGKIASALKDRGAHWFFPRRLFSSKAKRVRLKRESRSGREGGEGKSSKH